MWGNGQCLVAIETAECSVHNLRPSLDPLLPSRLF
jgi:hypothetical protein